MFLLVHAQFSISLLGAPFLKLFGGIADCSLVCDSSIGPISFYFSGLFFAYFATIGDHENELAGQIYLVLSSFDAWSRQ